MRYAPLLLLALASCGVFDDPDPIASITTVKPDTIVFHGQSLSTALLLRDMFDVRTADSVRLVGSGRIDASVVGTGWQVNGDVITAPDADSWATLTVSGDGVSASARIGSVVDLREGTWRFYSFSGCVSSYARDFVQDSSVAHFTFSDFQYLVPDPPYFRRIGNADGVQVDTAWLTYRASGNKVQNVRTMTTSHSLWVQRPDSIAFSGEEFWLVREPGAPHRYVHPNDCQRPGEPTSLTRIAPG